MEENFFEYKDNFAKYKHIKSNLLVGETENIPNPKITIAIPTYRRSYLIKDALNSAISQIKFENYEIVVIDNEASQEENETEKLIKQYNNPKILYYKNEENIGMYGNWNRCIELARGEYITILNDDDWLENNFLYEVIKEIKDNEGIFTLAKIHDYRNKNIKQHFLKKYLKFIYKNLIKMTKIKKLTLIDFFYANRSAGSLGILFKTECLKKLGGYNDKWFPSSDYFFHAYYCNEFGVILLKKELCNYRIQENESMKIEAAKKWPKQTYLFRNYLIKYLSLDKNFIFLNEVITENLKKQINLIWNLNIPYEKSLRNELYFIKMNLREILKNIS
ncbi:glycosyltransferase family 2 protein [Fusobacterium varium]|uniref:glycosyltransferase family 2 protein n=1 Tax=Fusobacterium varium TaxID=856 RepID=UPI001F47DD14|nr:glycosyltransferase family 2 protein [Fusobacterium varium]MCF2674458.1 glycosyltransferase family 2 protein [Fusobacterium varium]